MTSPDWDKIVAEAYRCEQLGLFSKAIDTYRRALEAKPGHGAIALRLLRLVRDVKKDPLARATLVWQVPPGEESWETDWVRYLLAGLDCVEIVDGRHQEFHDGSIVVDSRLDASKRNYYFELLKRRHRFVLLHLSDESYADDYTPYMSANAVIRNYWCRAHDADKNVLTVPLGMMNSFTVTSRKASRDRRHVWSFAGNVEKSSRAEMMAAMSEIGGGHLHCSDSIGPRTINKPDSRAPLVIAEYTKLMSETIFAPCPGGWENLDSFRVCEALEAGCIPIVESRPSYDYFRHLFGEHPMITIGRWNEIPALVGQLLNDPAALEAKRLACEHWWQDHKRGLVQRVQDTVRRAIA